MPTFLHNDLSITLPEGWGDASQFLFVASKIDGIQTNLVLSRQALAPGETLDALWKRHKGQLMQVLTTPKFLAEEAKLLGGRSGFWVELAAKHQGKSVHQMIFLFGAGPNLALSLAGTCAESEVESLRSTLTEALTSLASPGGAGGGAGGGGGTRPPPRPKPAGGGWR